MSKYLSVMSNSHLVILKKHYLDKILDGSKPVEVRLLKTASAPYGCIAVGDKLYLKKSAGPVCAVAEVSSFQEYRNLTAEKVMQLKAIYNHLIFGTDEYWRQKADSKFAVFVWLRKVSMINPTMINKKDWRAWVVLTEKQNYGLF